MFQYLEYSMEMLNICDWNKKLKNKIINLKTLKTNNEYIKYME